MPITRDDLRWWEELSPQLQWTYAKSMPQWPHKWVALAKELKRRQQGVEITLTHDDFVRAARVIHTFGQPAKFYSKSQVYLHSSDGSTRWWTMDRPLEITDLINMTDSPQDWGAQDAPVTETGIDTFYDSIAGEYNHMWSKPSDLEENEQVKAILEDLIGAQGLSTLDIGCGTGLLLDLGVVPVGLYTGVDPSRGMLNQLYWNHPKATRLIPGTFAGAIATDQLEAQYAFVAALFASASYLSDEERRMAVKLARKLCVMMTYQPGYVPDYYVGEQRDDQLANAAQAHEETVQLWRELAESRRYTTGSTRVGQFTLWWAKR